MFCTFTQVLIEPTNLNFGHSVSLESIKDFSEAYLKSLKAFAISKFKRVLKIEEELEGGIKGEIEKLVNPLVTSSAYGSFKFSIANDFLSRSGEKKELVELKANIVSKYHNEIFINPLADEDIEIIKKNYSDEEVNEIFRPLTKIKSNNSSYKVGYFESEDFNKKFISKIVNRQKQKLITVKQITQDDIGELESSITHKRSLQSGKVRKTTILREQLKKYEFDIRTNQIDPIDHTPIILSEEILLNVAFNSETGFTISFDDFRIEFTDIQYDKTLTGFYTAFYNKMLNLINKEEKNEEEQRDWNTIGKLIGSLGSLKK